MSRTEEQHITEHFVEIALDVRLRIRIDDFTDPWRSRETVLMVHGFGESGEVWFGWVPYLAAHYRVVRIDQRGFGESTKMSGDFAWSLDVLVKDLKRVVLALGSEPVHLVAAKIAGPVIMRFAAIHPELTRSITVVGSMSKGPSEVDEWLAHVEQRGVESWARTTMPPRLGSDMPPEAVAWWVALTSCTPLSTFRGLFKIVSRIDVTSDLPRIRCPALIITTDSKRRPVEKTKAWQQSIPNSQLLVLPGDAYHPAASAPDVCAEATRTFLASLKN